MSVISADKAREQRAQRVESALASGRIEGLEPSPAASAIFQKYIDGAISLDLMRAELLAYADQEYGPLRLSGNERPSESA